MHGDVLGPAIFPLIIFFAIAAFSGKKHYHIRFQHLRFSTIKYCPICGERKTFWKKVGLKTIILAIITKGNSLLLIPFYPKRCETCNLSAKYGWYREP
jgi:hypothetical protein